MSKVQYATKVDSMSNINAIPKNCSKSNVRTIKNAQIYRIYILWCKIKALNFPNNYFYYR